MSDTHVQSCNKENPHPVATQPSRHLNSPGVFHYDLQAHPPLLFAVSLWRGQVGAASPTWVWGRSGEMLDAESVGSSLVGQPLPLEEAPA